MTAVIDEVATEQPDASDNMLPVDLLAPNPFEIMILGGLQSMKVFEGIRDDRWGPVHKRREKNKVARRSRAVNRRRAK